jgi:hypothetical protein
MAVLHRTAHTVSDAAHSILVWPSQERLQTKGHRLSAHCNRIFQQARQSSVTLRAEWKEDSMGTASVCKGLIWTSRLLYRSDKVIIWTRNEGRSGNTLALSQKKKWHCGQFNGRGRTASRQNIPNSIMQDPTP